MAVDQARAVRCWVKSRNEQATALLLSCHPQGGTLGGLLRITERKVGMRSSQHGLYVQGYTRVTMRATKCREPARGS